MHFPKCELNSRGLNTKIKCQVLSDDEMRALGFREIKAYSEMDKDVWTMSKGLVLPKELQGLEVCFYISIAKDASSWTIDVIDDEYGQPYDYQDILENIDENNKYALAVWQAVEGIMKTLAKNNIVIGHKRGDYI